MKVLVYVSKQVAKAAQNTLFIASLKKTLGHEITFTECPKWGMRSKTLRNYQLIHVFGCTDFHAAMLIRKAYSLRIPTLLSPLGDLHTWNPANTTIRHLFYIKRMLQRCAAIHVTSLWEQRTMENNIHLSRLFLVKNPATTAAISPEECGKMIFHLYHKVLDSNVYPLVDDDILFALGNLLQAAVDDDMLITPEWKAETRHEVMSLTERQWRLLQLYAHDENVESLFQSGITALNIERQTININEIERFDNLFELYQGTIPVDKLLWGSLLLKDKLNTILIPDDKEERKLCYYFLNLKHLVTEQKVSIRHLIELYRLLRFSNFDEDRLATILKELSILVFAARIISLLQYLFNLPDGFCPFKGRDDRQTQNLLQYITKTNTKLS